MGRVAGKVALVTGAARGQGRAHALRLAEEGADINLTGVSRHGACGGTRHGRARRRRIARPDQFDRSKGLPQVAHYTAAKHGVVGLMKSPAAELGPANIRVNAIHPSAGETDMVKNHAMYHLFRPDLDNPGPEDFSGVFGSLHLLPEVWVQPRDISNAVLFLASDEGKYITGQQLKIDLEFCEK